MSTVRFFPHEIADLTIVLDFFALHFGSSKLSPAPWEVFHSVLLWLSLVCMIPFDLDQFDEANERGKTAEAIEGIAKRFLGRSGVERQGAALVLSRLYTRWVFNAFSVATLADITPRADTKSRLNGFITWGEGIIHESTDLFLVSSSIIAYLGATN